METSYETTPVTATNETLFGEINLALPVQAKLQELGFSKPTEIQKHAIPILLEKGTTNFHGQAQTGTGKTLAFGLPLLHRIDQEHNDTQGLVIAPTRELALQIVESLMPFAQALDVKIVAVFGGVSIEDQIRKLNRGAHIVVGTPGRITDHLKRKTLDLSRLKTLVLDEADIMLDMGFRDDIEAIMNYTPHDREIWLFSATVKSGIRDIISKYMPDVQSISASKTQIGASTTKQYFCMVPSHSRLDALCRFIECAPDFYGFIFCQTKMLTSEIADQLARRGLIVGALHGDLSQTQRNSVIKKFKSRDYSIVVATDVAGRGIDIQDLTHVINYSLPEDFESYVHRTGRTGRAGKEGIAISFINRSQAKDINTIERKFKITINPIEVPTRDQIIAQRLAHVAEYAQEKLVESVEETIPGQAQRAISTTLAHLTAEQWQTLAAHLIYEKHLKSAFESKKDIASYATKERSDENSEQVDEIMFHIGLDDNLTEQEFRTVLLSKTLIQENQILKIRMIRRRTFVRVLPECIEQVISALKDEELAGRKLRGTVYKEERNRTPRRTEHSSNERTSRGYQGGSRRETRGGYQSERSSSFRPARRSENRGERSEGSRFGSEGRERGTGSSSRFGGESRERSTGSSRFGSEGRERSTGSSRFGGENRERSTGSSRFGSEGRERGESSRFSNENRENRAGSRFSSENRDRRGSEKFGESRDRFEEKTFKKSWNKDF